jgi:small-conductance mechanosensitive channel
MPVQKRLWPLVLAYAVMAFAFVALPHLLLPAVAPSWAEFVRIGLTAVWAALAVTVVRRAPLQGLQEVRQSPPERRSVVNLGLQVLLGVLVVAAFVVTADIWHVSLTGLALGGAVTGVVIGLAAQSMLGNVIAGAMLLSLRPMHVGEWVSLRSWMSGGIDASGRVEEINFFYTVLREAGLRRVVPNSAVAVATIVADELQSSYTQTLTLPISLAPAEAAEILAPLRRREVAEVREDAYVLRIEWDGDRSSRSERLEHLLEHMSGGRSGSTSEPGG